MLILANESKLYRALGFLDGVATSIEDATIRTAIYDAIEQLESALTEDKPND